MLSMFCCCSDFMCHLFQILKTICCPVIFRFNMYRFHWIVNFCAIFFCVREHTTKYIKHIQIHIYRNKNVRNNSNKNSICFVCIVKVMNWWHIKNKRKEKKNVQNKHVWLIDSHMVGMQPIDAYNKRKLNHEFWPYFVEQITCFWRNQITFHNNNHVSQFFILFRCLSMSKCHEGFLFF